MLLCYNSLIINHSEKAKFYKFYEFLLQSMHNSNLLGKGVEVSAGLRYIENDKSIVQPNSLKRNTSACGNQPVACKHREIHSVIIEYDIITRFSFIH